MEWHVKAPERAKAGAFDEAVSQASAASIAAMEWALAMVWHCLDCDLSKVASRVEVQHEYDARGERRVVLDGRIIHRQWWEQTGEHTLTLRQEWCP